ncbi:MAG TPA: cyanophycin synthetase [Planctomycetaceae bacterium]|nr:cyanophycin synthetase [Planctomycetaceae bacterium]
MKILEVRALRGPNIWLRRPVLEAWVDLGPLKDTSSELMPGFNDRLMAWLPGMIEHRCSPGERGGFFIRLRRGTYLAHILEHVTLELQDRAGTPCGFGRARESEIEGIYKVAIEYQEEAVGRACLDAGYRLCLAAVFDQPFDVAGEVAKLRDLVDRVCLGPSTQAIVGAAKQRNIPFRRLNAGSLVQLGYGAKQRRIWTAETDQTSAIAESIAQDKDLTKAMLRSAGVPVPSGRLVDSPEDAWAAAQRIGGAIVVKPLDGNHGRGVFMDLTDEQQIKTAYGEALKEGSGVIVEEFAPGREHRLLIIGGELVAAARGDAVTVIGDGRHTVAELIELQVNSDPRRGETEDCPLNPVLIDAVTLAEIQRQGHVPSDIIADGVKLLVRRNDNLSEDCTDLVHPTTAEHAILAAQVVGLDIAGLDLVVEDISKPLEVQGGRFVEVNAGPGLLPHLKPVFGKPRPVGEAIIGSLFPEGETGRIPLVCVTGTNGKTTTTRLVTSILKAAGRHVGMTCTDGIFVDGRTIELADCAGPRSAKNVLLNPLVDAAVFECARGGILREGLGFDKCDVAIVTNLGSADHLGQYDLHTPEQMYKVKRCGVDVVLPTGTAVLNAADPLVVEMATLSAGSVTFFSINPEHPVVVEHRKNGKRAVIFTNGAITLCEGQDERPLLSVEEIPCTHRGRVPFQIENVLAAVAAAWHLNIPSAVICQGLQAFQGNLVDNPCRFSVMEGGGKTLVIMDGRNELALNTLLTAIDKFPHTKRSVVYSAEGDRRAEDIRVQGAQLGTGFDRVYLCDLDGGQDRPAGEVVDLLRQGLEGATRTQEIREITDWSAAVETAWRQLGRGELLVVQSATIPRTVRKIYSLLGLEPADGLSPPSEGGAWAASVA